MRTEVRPRWVLPSAAQAVSMAALVLLLAWMAPAHAAGSPSHAGGVAAAALLLVAGWLPPTVTDSRLAHAVGWGGLACAGTALASLGLAGEAVCALTAVVLMTSVVWPVRLAVGLTIGAVLPYDLIMVLATNRTDAAVFPSLLWTFVFIGARGLRQSQLEHWNAEEAAAARVEAAVLRERTRIARDIHDSVGHSLSVVALQLETAQALLPQQSADCEIHRRIERAANLVRQGLDDLRHAVAMLRGDRFSGLAAIRGLVADFERDTGIHCDVRLDEDGSSLPVEVQVTAYRAVQEALTNASRHGRPICVRVHLRSSCAGLSLCVVNDGADGAASDDGVAQAYGLRGIRERAEALGGRMATGARDDKFWVRLEVPR